MARKKKQEEHVNHERWLVSYADFITLLFAFFVVMYSISSVNEGKYRVLSDSISSAFDPSERGLPIKFSNPLKAPIVSRPVQSSSDVSDSSQNLNPSAYGGVEASKQDKITLKKISTRVEKGLAPLIDKNLVKINKNDLWIEIEIKSSILYPSGSARLQPQAAPVLRKVAKIVSEFDNQIQVEGFTDNVPIDTDEFPSNWELSAARAANAFVKLPGICWINTIGTGKLAGSALSTFWRATGPPVDVPIATSFVFPLVKFIPLALRPESERCCEGIAVEAIGLLAMVGADCETGDRAVGRRIEPTARTRSHNNRRASSRSLEISSKRFGRKSTAPASRASNVDLAPSVVNEENIKIAVGLAVMIFRVAVIPSITGISTSMVITSGFRRAALLTASIPFSALSMTLISGSDSNISVTRRRKKRESSTTNTRTDISNPLA